MELLCLSAAIHLTLTSYHSIGDRGRNVINGIHPWTGSRLPPCSPRLTVGGRWSGWTGQAIQGPRIQPGHNCWTSFLDRREGGQRQEKNHLSVKIIKERWKRGAFEHGIYVAADTSADALWASHTCDFQKAHRLSSALCKCPCPSSIGPTSS